MTDCMEKPAGVGRRCLDCKWLNEDNEYCEHTMRAVPLTDEIPEIGCMTYQYGFGDFEPKEEE